jgi:adenine nucleotide transporter 17
MAAGWATVMITNPIWVVNTRMTTAKRIADDAENDTKSPPLSRKDETVAQDKKAPTMVQVLRQMVQEEGLGSLFHGVTPALILVSNPSIQYMVFEQAKSKIERFRRGALTPLDIFLLGAFSKLIATSLTYPYMCAFC